MGSVATLFGASALAVVMLGAFPAIVSACTGPIPTFAEAVHGARAIARVTVLEDFQTYLEDPTHSETYRVDRVLKGSLPDLVTVAPAWTLLCHDSVGYYAKAKGTVIILAIDMPFHDQVIHPMWKLYEGEGVSGTAEVPSAIATLADLESAIRSELGLPDTATDEGTDIVPPPIPWVPLTAIGTIVTAVLTLYRLRPSSHPTE